MAHFRFHHTISSLFHYFVRAFYEVHQRDSQVLGVLLNIWISSSSTLAQLFGVCSATVAHLHMQ